MADAYGLPSSTFMERAFGYSRLSDREIDLSPPADLLMTIAERTGIATSKVRSMTLAGYVPLLLDSLTPGQGLFKTYVSQFPAFARVQDRFRRPVFLLDEDRWLPWISREIREQPPICRQCVAQDIAPYRRIFWRAGWMTCCPVHHEMLETGFFLPSVRRDDLYAYTPRRAAAADIVALDGLTLEAVTEVSLLLPHGREISAAVWIRALRTLIDDLIRPQYTLVGVKHIMSAAWRLAGMSLHEGLGMGRIFEDMSVQQRETVFAVAAATVKRLLQGDLDTRHSNVRHWSVSTVFDPPPALPDRDLPSLPPRAEVQTDAATDWERLWAAAVDEAKRSPLQAYKLRQMMIWRLPASQIDGVDFYLRDLGIPVITAQPAP